MAKSDDSHQQPLTRRVSATQIGIESGIDITSTYNLTLDEKTLVAEKQVPFFITSCKRIEGENRFDHPQATGYFWALRVMFGSMEKGLTFTEYIINQNLFDTIARYTEQSVEVGPFTLRRIEGKFNPWFRLVRADNYDPDSGMTFEVMVEDALLQSQMQLESIES